MWFSFAKQACVYSQTEIYTGSSRVEPRKVLIRLVDLLLECSMPIHGRKSTPPHEKVLNGEYTLTPSSESSDVHIKK